MDTKATDMQRAAYSVGASEYLGVLAGEVNEAMRRTDEVLAEYERIKPLIELADSNPTYRLAVVDTKITTSDRAMDENFELQRITYYLVVKMEDK